MGRSPVILTCAVTGSADTTKKNPAVPVTPAEIAKASIEAAEAGAAIVHIHVRDPETGKASLELDLYRDVHDRIKASGSDVIINLTGGPGGRFRPSAQEPRVAHTSSTLTHPSVRVQHIKALRPEMCSLDVVTMNRAGFISMNTEEHLLEMGKTIFAAGSKPEIEVFDSGNIPLAIKLSEKIGFASPLFFQLCLGVKWGATADMYSLLHMRSMLPEHAVWAAFGIGGQQFPMLAMSALAGGHVRVGFEDNLYLERDRLAKSNAELVEKGGRILDDLGFSLATPSQARTILNLAPKS